MTDTLIQKNHSYDKLLLGFVLIFVISLTNSIFVNQIGYFGALLILVILFLGKKRNLFEKSGLELPFVLFLSAEFISALLSYNNSSAFTIFFKRLILIPIIYVILAAANDSSKIKTIFKFYLGAALLTIIAYILFAYEHFIAQLYQLELHGPSPFQYVMTAGGLMSFTTILTFAFLVNEKGKIITRVFYLIAFLVSSIALFATYTRAAWLGAIVGIGLILILKKKWPIIILGIVLIILFFIVKKNESSVLHYKVINSQYTIIDTIYSGSRINKIDYAQNKFLIADHENGLVVLDSTNRKIIKTPAPVTSLLVSNDSTLLAYLMDTRFIVLNKNINGYYVQKEFYSPGNTTDFKKYGPVLYSLDSDSGLTQFNCGLNYIESFRLKDLGESITFAADSSYFVSFNKKKQLIELRKINGGIPEESIIDSIEYKTSISMMWNIKDKFLLQSDRELILFSINDSRLEIDDRIELTGMFRFLENDGKYYGLTIDGKLLELGISHAKLSSSLILKLDYSPSDFIMREDDLYISYYKKNRLLSIFDSSHETNFERLQIWETGFKILADHPIFGVGDIDLSDLYKKYKSQYVKEVFGHLHNNYIHFLIILGVVGFTAVLYLLGSILWLQFKIYKSLREVDFASSYSLGSLAVFVGFLFSGIGEWNFGDQEIITFIWFSIGLNIAVYKIYAVKYLDKVNN